MTKRHSMRLFYIDGETHVSIPYTQLDGPMAETGASTPKSFIARVGKNTDYALPYDPECVHMRERSRKYMEPVPGLNTICSPNGHYAFRPEPGPRRNPFVSRSHDPARWGSRLSGCVPAQ